jgi:CheY-like chemotaxis protein
MARALHFTIVPDSSEINTVESALRSRWISESALVSQVRSAMANGINLPPDIASVDVSSGDSNLKLLDLRGMDFRKMRIGKIDLSYCCFDFADFSEAIFEGTELQFSSLNYACMERAVMLSVQGAPLSAQHASFKAARIAESFLMHSDFDGADFSGIQIERVRFTGSNLQNVKFEDANIQDCEVSEALFSENATNHDLVVHQGFTGMPRWMPIEDQYVNVSVHRDVIDKSIAWATPQRQRGDTRKHDVVMIVDDSATVRKSLERLFSQAGYEVLLAHDGIQAQHTMTITMPDVLVLDIEMPNLSGIELTRLLRKNDRYTKLPIVMITSKVDKYDRDEAIRAGATAFFPKSVHPDDLEALIRRLLTNRLTGLSTR